VPILRYCIKIIVQLGAADIGQYILSFRYNVEAKRKQNNKQHEVWELSFDWKKCRTKDFILQRLNYIHLSPCTKK
jgi:hypothetical protein